jgi:D-aspartate ligase
LSDRLPPVIVSPVFVNGTSVLRAFARRGAHCVAVSSRADVPGFATRAAAEKVLLPDMASSDGAFAQWLFSRKDLYGALVIPTADEVVAELDANRKALEKAFMLSLPSHEVCEMALDKWKLAEASLRARVPTPRTVLCRLDDPEASWDAGFPALVKPCYCIKFSRLFGRKALLANTADELAGILSTCRERRIEAVIQEFLPAETPVASYNGYVRRSGEIAGDFTSLRPGMFPPVTGTGFLEIAQAVPEVLEYARRFLESVAYSGALVNMDFKIAADGQWKLLDVNARSWRQISLAPLVGVDVFEHLLRDYLDRPPLTNGPVRYGKSWFYLKDALLMARAYPEQAPSILRYLPLVSTNTSFGLLELADPMPFIEDIKPLILRRLRADAVRYIDQ